MVVRKRQEAIEARTPTRKSLADIRSKLRSTASSLLGQKRVALQKAFKKAAGGQSQLSLEQWVSVLQTVQKRRPPHRQTAAPLLVSAACDRQATLLKEKSSRRLYAGTGVLPAGARAGK